MTIRHDRRAHHDRATRRTHRPGFERMEGRRLLSAADGGGPVVTSLIEMAGHGAAQIVIRFDGPLDAAKAENAANYGVALPGGPNHEFVTSSAGSIAVRSASYNDATHEVTLTLARPLAAGQYYRVWINGQPGSGLTGADGTLFDGDNDDTPGGDFYGLIAQGKTLGFTDQSGDRGTVQVRGGGVVELWRELDGNINQLTVAGAVAGQTVLTGSVRPARGSDGVVAIPSMQGLDGVINRLPSPPFVRVPPPPQPSPAPVVATSQNLPFSLQIEAVPMPSVPSIQSAVYAQSGGKWLLFGGRTNGLHNFNPSGLSNFPPTNQNNDIFVIDPATGQTWSMPWSETGLPASVTASLSSSNQEFYQKGNQLYTVGGYSFDSSMVFTTYDTLSSINVSGLIAAVMNHDNASSLVQQIHDPRFTVTGGEMQPIGGRTYLVFGQNFQGGYSFPPTGTQIYTDQVESFRILGNGHSLAITGYRAQRDPVDFRRRDYNLGAVVFPNGRQGLTAYGGVFTPDGNGYRHPIVIGPNGTAHVDLHYQQYFTQYSAARVPLFDARDRAMNTIFFGGISLYHYDFATGTLSTDTELPFVNDVTTFVQRADGSTQEYMMPSQLPGRYGTEAAFFLAPGVPHYSNGVVKLSQLKAPTTLGYIYGGIYSTAGDTTDPSTQTTASNQVFRVTLVPNP